MTKRLIRNNEPNIKDFAPTKKNQEPLVLIPGINEVDQEQIDWIQSQENSSWIFWLETKAIEFVELEKETTGEVTSELSFDDLENLRSDDAIKLVEGTNSVEALRGWQLRETRKGVGKAIMDKLDLLLPKRKGS